MKKYTTPEIELEVFKTADVITVSQLSWEQSGSGNLISWTDDRWENIQ